MEVSLDCHVVPDIFIKFVEGLFGVYYNRAVVRFSNPLGVDSNRVSVFPSVLFPEHPYSEGTFALSLPL